MGGFTRNRRKRTDDSFTNNYNFTPFPTDNNNTIPLSKKLKLHHNSRSTTTASVVARVQQYPQAIHPFRRRVHAPCGGGASVRMGNSVRKYVVQPVLGGLSRLRLWRSGNDKERIGDVKEVIDVSDHDEETGRCVQSVEDEEEEDMRIEVIVHGKGGEEVNLVQPSCSSVVVSEDLKVEESEGKVWDMVAMKRGGLDDGIPVYKRLWNDSSKRRDGKLRSLKLNIGLLWGHWSIQQLYRRPAKKEEEDVRKEPFVPLTEEEELEVKVALSNSKRRKVLVTHENSNIEITGELLQCLAPRAWLNDEVINLYLELLKEREKRDPKKFLKCHFFNTFFYKKLIGGRSGYDFKSVRRWTTPRKLGYSLLECDKIFVPIHKEIHWCLAVINKKDKKFQYLDSLRGYDKQVMKVLAKYIVDEVKEKSDVEIDVGSWEHECVEDLPKQENGFDCGMFMIKYCDFYSRDIGLCFGQGHMPYFRLRTAKEILRLKAD